MGKKIKLFLLFTGLAIPALTYGHGGVQKQAGNTTIYISQNPISPLVGEEIEITFVLKQGLNEPLVNADVELALIDTFYGDESRDKVILTQQKKTDANEAFEFSYRFNKESYFDVDLKFKDLKTGEIQQTGYLIQPRNRTIMYKNNVLVIFAVGIAGIIIGLGINNTSRKLTHL